MPAAGFLPPSRFLHSWVMTKSLLVPLCVYIDLLSVLWPWDVLLWEQRSKSTSCWVARLLWPGGSLGSCSSLLCDADRFPTWMCLVSNEPWQELLGSPLFLAPDNWLNFNFTKLQNIEYGLLAWKWHCVCRKMTGIGIYWHYDWHTHVHTLHYTDCTLS